MLLNSEKTFNKTSSAPHKVEVEEKIKFPSPKNQFFKSIGIVNVTLARNLLLLFAILNLATIGYTNLVVRANRDPFSESKVINEMVIYHFLATQFLGLMFLISTFVKED